MEGSWREAEPHEGNISALKTVQVKDHAFQMKPM